MPDDREDGVVQGSAGRRCALQFPANERAEILQGTDLRFRGLAAGARLPDGKRPYLNSRSGDHGDPSVEANSGGTGDEREVRESLVRGGIGYHEGFGAADRM